MTNNPFEAQPLVPSCDGNSSSHPSHRAKYLVHGIVGLILLIALIQCNFVVEPGTIGIVVTLGHIKAYGPGMHFRTPYVSTLDIISAKTQVLEQKNMIPTKEGLSVKLDTAVLYHLDQTKVADLYTKVGTRYSTVLLEPQIASAVRGLTSESEAKALYTDERNNIQDALKQELTQKLNSRGIIIEDVLLKDVGLPEELSKSIEMKMQAEQEAARMEFVLQKEQQEAQRKAIEAQGIADFQRIVSEGISEPLLQWKGVEATERFASSPNTKIVLIGNGGNNLPVILSTEEN